MAEVSHKIEGKIRTLVHDMKGGLWIASTEGVFKCNITPEGFQVAKNKERTCICFDTMANGYRCTRQYMGDCFRKVTFC